MAGVSYAVSYFFRCWLVRWLLQSVLLLLVSQFNAMFPANFVKKASPQTRFSHGSQNIDKAQDCLIEP